MGESQISVRKKFSPYNSDLKAHAGQARGPFEQLHDIQQ